MKKRTVNLFHATVLFGIVMGFLIFNLAIENKKNKGWEIYYFPTIDKLCRETGFKSLRNYRVKGDDEEIRLWAGFGLAPLKGVILKKRQNEWKGWFVQFSYDSKRRKTTLTLEIFPKSSWKNLLERLNYNNIKEFPDDSELPDDGVLMLDGTSYVVEIAENGNYRTYQYGNPRSHPKWPEAKKIIEILDTLSIELDIHLSPGSITKTDKNEMKEKVLKLGE